MLACLFSVGVLTVAAGDEPAGRPPELTFKKHIDYAAWYNRIVERGGGDEKNAAAIYLRFNDKSEGRPGTRGTTGRAEDGWRRMQRVWKPEAYPDLAKYLQGQSPNIALANEAAALADCWLACPPKMDTLLAMRTEPIPALRDLGVTLALRGLMKQSNQAETIRESVKLLVCGGTHLQQMGPPAGCEVGLTNRQAAYRVLRTALAEGGMSGRDARAALDVLTKYDGGAPDVERYLRIDWCWALDALQAVAPRGKPDLARFDTLRQAVNAESAAASPARTFDAAEAARLIDAYYSELLRIRARPISLEAIRAVMAHDAKHLSRPEWRNNAFLRDVVVGKEDIFRHMLRAETDRRGTRLVLAMHAHYAEKGRWPASLDEFPIDNLKRARIDPYSGKDFVYRMEHGEPNLYTVGFDGDDDGGVHEPAFGEGQNNGDFNFWPHYRTRG
ncbi:MAG: hypothetical protein L6R00_05340 [Phycisphaerae bacterium]|nr:hypothetical protein [Phycisphaerae bacterium]